MKNLRFFSFLVLVLMVTLSSCFEDGDDVLPVSPVEAKASDIVGAWKLYYIHSPVSPKDGLPVADAAIWVNSDFSLKVRRKGIIYYGTWSLSKDGGYVAFTLNNAEDIDVPGQWSIQHLTDEEMWLNTSIKEMRFKRLVDDIVLPKEVIEN
jgi:hypothetical protein